MSKAGKRTEVSEDDLFAQQAKTLFDQSVAGLDGQTQSRLNRGRQAALAELGSGAPGFGRWTQWVPATGVAAVAVLAVVLWQGDSPPDPLALPAPGDFELLMADDSFEMLQDLEFYSWIDMDVEPDHEGADADVG